MNHGAKKIYIFVTRAERTNTRTPTLCAHTHRHHCETRAIHIVSRNNNHWVLDLRAANREASWKWCAHKKYARHTHTHACALSAALTTIVPTTAPGDKDLDQIYRSDGRTKSFFVRSSNTTDVLSSSLGDYDLEPRVCNYLSQPWMATFIWISFCELQKKIYRLSGK